MALIAGADGCPGGWVCVARDTETGKLSSRVYPTAQALVHQEPVPSLLAVDIPIGLSDGEPRECDAAARGLLGMRGCTVFPAPVRPALDAETYDEACHLTHLAVERRVSRQAWGIFPKVREVDALMLVATTLQDRVREVHPEVSFCAWNGGVPMSHSKKRLAGRAERQVLIARVFGATAFAEARACHPARLVGNDDLADAFAALWTAQRIHQGSAAALPVRPQVDARGLAMQIWY